MYTKLNEYNTDFEIRLLERDDKAMKQVKVSIVDDLYVQYGLKFEPKAGMYFDCTRPALAKLNKALKNV